ncbi:hypothetical protein RRG08_003396 [Elysia crispata]|uniref:Uncharacterized protein n=1 Tax=Elysia crispata TaxID=231223 RepID=A0AAE1DWZ2_9GAST|nr:hypothetical protein RRG08_003396 [Elysia crispata]
MSKRKSGNFPHSYSERNLRSARNNLKTYISNIEPENTYGDLLKILAESPNHQNVWEGETGMMEHIQPLFPMPQRMSVLIDQQKTLNMCRPTTYSIGQNLTKAANLLEKRNYDVNDQSPLGQTSSMTFDQRNNFIDGDQILPSGNLRLVPDNSDDPSLQSTSIASNCISSIVTDIEISDEAETEDSDACHDIVIKRTKTLNSTKKGKARKKRINFSNPSGSNLNLGRQFVVDMVRKDKTKASDLYVAKIEEWAGIVSDIQNISDELKKLLTPEFQICEQYPETVYKTWRQHRYLELQQGKPLISPMTPGLTAGVYAKEGSVHERFSRWLTQISELAEEAVPVAAFSDSGKSSFVLSKPEHCHINVSHSGEEAVVLNKFAFVPTSHSLDLSLCSITKYDETSLKNCGRDGPSFCTEFQNIYHDWRSQALELEHSLKEADVVLNLRGAESILTTRTEVACQALFNACVSLQSLNTKYVCAKLSQRPHNRSATWRFSKPLCEIIGFDARKKLSFQFNCLYRLLKRVGKTCCGIGEESKSLIQLYNKQVEEAQIVQLPMSLSEISDEVRDLLCKGCIPETPLEKMSYLSEKTLDCNVLHHKAASSNIPLSNDCPNDEGILPSVASANNQVSKNFGINLSSDFVTTCNQQTQNKNLPNHEIFAHSVINEKQSDQLSVAFQDLPRPDTIENVGHCECGCHGTPLLNSVEMTMEVHGGAPGNELSWLQHDIKQLQNSLSEAEAQLNSRETPQHKTYKLIVDISATLPYLRTRLNRERGQTFKHGCSDLSNSVGKESREVNCAQNVGDTTDFLTVHESLASLYEDLHRIFLEEREVILDIFPHAEDFKNKRGELIQFFAPLKINKYKLSKNHIRKMKRAARIAAEKASRPPDVIVKEQELESYQRLCSALNLLKKVRGYLSHVTICVFKSGGVAKFEALKDSQKRMTNLFRNLELCSRKLSPESSLHLRDFQMGEIPKHLHAAFKTFPGDGAGVNAQAQVVLQRCYTSFQIIMKKFSPEFVENLGIQFSLE